MSEALEQVRSAGEQAKTSLASAGPDTLDGWRSAWLGGKGRVKALMKLLALADPAERPAIGQAVNGLRDELESLFAQQKGAAAPDRPPIEVDVTEPGRRPPVGRRHPVLRTADELTELFGRMGFEVADGPELEDEYHNFVALNIPESHPARDPLDNFYLADADPARPELLRTQTSTVQVRVMKSRRPPLRVVIPGRVYRPDTHDDTHLSMFHQLEALVVDAEVTFVDLKSTVLQFVRAYFGGDTKVRFRPSFFPFTEPSAEVDVWFPDQARWIELGGCGMVHPDVLRACDIDPEALSGWAFGFGIERIAMRKYGVGNIRQFIENDVRFLSQF